MIEDTDKQAVILYRIESAHKTLEEVNVNIQYQFWNSAINRMYYACYYAVSALLIANDISAQTHKGVKQMFCKEFISTGLLPREAGKIFVLLFDKRCSGDYEDFITYDEKTVLELYPLAKDFINRVEALL